MLTRREFIRLSAFGGAGIALGGGLLLDRRRERFLIIRPPGALAEERFLSSCVRCFKCGNICPNTAIRFMGPEYGPAAMDTPYILPRDQACMLCMKCTQVCPTDALQKIADDPQEILTRVRMGKAVVDENLCYSYNGRTCGVCYRACPYPDVALKVKLFEQPVVLDKCVGCGLCERVCIHIPQAIRIYTEV